MSPSEDTPPTLGLPSPSALRIVLFGMPAAGKSSLLGALARAARTQEAVLGGQLTDLSRDLEELERRVYEGGPKQTLEEIAPFPIRFQPGVPPGSDSIEAVLVDCDGRVAGKLLAGQWTRSPRGPLTEALLRADALILAIDASDPPTRAEEDFLQFSKFLRVLEQGRGRRADVNGLPAFLVLTKCDLLAQSNDTIAAWTARVQEREQDVASRFGEFLQHAARSSRPIFGAIDLHPWATAVRAPALVGAAPAASDDPFGVAELFGRGIRQAGMFRQRQRTSGRRMVGAVAGATALLAAMLAVAGAMVLGRPREPTALESRVAAYRSAEGDSPAERLAQPLSRRLAELQDIERDPGYSALAAEDRDFVSTRLDEFEAYRSYLAKLSVIRPGEVHSLANLGRLAARLGEELAPPPPYRDDWAQTDAGKLQGRLLRETQGLRQAGAEAERAYRKQVRDGEELWTFAAGKPGDAASWGDWLRQVETLLATRAWPTGREREEQASVPAVLSYREVQSARADWELERPRLRRLRDLVAALGLGGPSSWGQRAPLDIPEGFTANQATDALKRFQALYPELVKDPAPNGLPDALAPTMRQAARVRYGRLMQAGQQVVLEELQRLSPDGRENPKRWRVLRDWLLKDPVQFQEWRLLAEILAKLAEASPANSVTALADFLGKDRFELRVRDLTLQVPTGLGLTPSGPLTLYHQRDDQPPIKLVFRPAVSERGEHRSPTASSEYEFRPDHAADLTYQPGDQLWAELPLRREGDDSEWRFTWSVCHSQVYQFERLLRHPRLHRRDQPNTTGKVAEGVVLTSSPPDGVPVIPDLLPVVRLASR